MNAAVLYPAITLVIGGIGGYFLGLFHANLTDKIRTLGEQPKEEVKPIITMGEYERPTTRTTTDSPVGLVETKTPQLVEFEAEQETERLGLGQ